MTSIEPNAVIENDENKKTLLEIVRQAVAYDGSFEDLEVWPNEDEYINELLYGLQPADAIRRVYYGNWRDGDEYVTLDGYGNLESKSEYDVFNDVWEQKDAIIEWANDNETEVSGFLDELELDEDEDDTDENQDDR